MEQLKQKLITDRNALEDLVAAMERGEQQSFTVDTRTGVQTEVTADRIEMFKRTIESLGEVIDSISGKSK